MKPKITALLIVITTALIIGSLTFILNRQSHDEAFHATEAADLKEDRGIQPLPHKGRKIIAQNNKIIKNRPQNEDGQQGEEDEDSASNHGDLSKEDIKLIKSVAALSDSDLKKEVEALQDVIEKENLFELLEEGELPKEKEATAKETLEKFALLGLEQTRRKYMAVEPELKDPVLAHRESLKEIRELLSDED